MGTPKFGGDRNAPPRSRARVEADVDAELAFHLEMVAGRLEADGWSPADAAAEARRRFGDVDHTRRYCGAEDIKMEQHRRRTIRFDEFAQDVRYALRSLRKAPVFAVIVLLTLGLGIGANSAIFSVVRGVLLEPLPFHEPDRVVRVWLENKGSGVPRGLVSEPDFLDWRRESKRAASIGAYFHAEGLSDARYTGGDRPERVKSALVAHGFFETLGTRAFLGRTIGDDDQLEGRNRVIVLSYRNWQTRFGGDPDIVGRRVGINDEPYTVIGVMPDGFVYPSEHALDVWIPLSVSGPNDIGRSRAAAFQNIVARLAPGATETQLREELSGIAVRLSREYPDNPGWESVTTQPLRDSIVGSVQKPLTLLLVAVFLVLLTTCANVANLLLARASSRQRELAVRAALGAGRPRIVRQLLTESVVLSLAGGVLGILLAFAALDFVKTNGTMIPRVESLAIDTPVLLFTLAVSLLAGLAFGVAPALRATGASPEQVLRAGGRGNTSLGVRLRSTLVVVQVALAVVLVTTAALTTKSFAQLLSTDLGFEPNGALFVATSVPERESREARIQLYQQALEAIRQVPGVQAAGAMRDLPTLGRGEVAPATVAGAAENADKVVVQYHQVSTDFFRAMQIPMRAGRAFEEGDRMGAPLVVVVNEEFVRRALAGRDPLTQALQFGDQRIPIVGVVGNVRQSGAMEAQEPAVYLHVAQSFRSRMSIVVRTSGDPSAVIGGVRQALWGLDPNFIISQTTPLADVMSRSVSRPRLLAAVFAMFGLLGLALGVLGVYGVLAFSVAQRQQEIGVRVALGATPSSVLSMVVRQGLILAAFGVAAGVVLMLVASRLVEATLYGVSGRDLSVYVQVATFMTLAALLASWVPARRATRVDPMVALRNE